MYTDLRGADAHRRGFHRQQMKERLSKSRQQLQLLPWSGKRNNIAAVSCGKALMFTGVDTNADVFFGAYCCCRVLLLHLAIRMSNPDVKQQAEYCR